VVIPQGCKSCGADIGWSIAQILSFIPNVVGQIAGLIGMILVLYHWLQIVKINKLLSER
jgi:hypothetical protein